MTDFRELCARMADELDHYRQLLMDDRRETHALAAEARAALAQPEPQRPTDEELVKHYDRAVTSAIAIRVAVRNLTNEDRDAATVVGLRAVLARWGRPAIKPVPVAERLPKSEDCDAEGRCFVWDWLATEWHFLEKSIFDYGWQDAYWLPHHALPVPQQEADR